MRILFITHSFKQGGAEKCLALLVQHCRARGNECVVIGPRDGSAVEPFEQAASKVYRVRLSIAHVNARGIKAVLNVVNLIANVFVVAAIIRRHRPDVVYSNTSAVMAGALAAALTRVPHIWHIHENVRTFQVRFVLPLAAMRRVVSACSARVIFVSALAMDALFPRGDAKATVIHNGVDVQPLPVAANDGAPVAEPRIAFFGALCHRKGLDVLIRALSIVRNDYPGVSLDVWGQGYDEYVDRLRQLARSLGTDRQLAFRGYCADVPRAMRNYALVAVPSRAESFSLVALEAMSAGVPVVVTRCGGPEEFVSDGVDGWVVPAEDHRALARAIVRSLDHPDECRVLTTRARAKAINDFSLSSSLGKILAEFERVGRPQTI